MGHDPPRTLSTVETTCEIVEELERQGGATVTEVATALNLSKGGAYNHLATLRETGYVTKEDGEYALSYKFLNKGRYVLDTDLLYRAGRNTTKRLAADTGEFTHLMTCQNGRGIYLLKEKGEKGISEDFNKMKMRKHDYLHWSSSGKAYLAHLPTEEAKRIIDEHGLPSMNENTITDPDDLLDELEAIREQGYAVNDQEEIVGTRAIGAPIMNDRGLYGAVSISGPKSRFTYDEIEGWLSEKVLEAANIISVNITTIQNQE